MCHTHADGRESGCGHRTDVSLSESPRVASANNRSIEYAKKKDKRATVKTARDEAVRGDAVYKSQTVSVGSGESPNSGGFFGARQHANCPDRA